jgi:hypothetical protein
LAPSHKLAVYFFKENLLSLASRAFSKGSLASYRITSFELMRELSQFKNSWTEYSLTVRTVRNKLENGKTSHFHGLAELIS